MKRETKPKKKIAAPKTSKTGSTPKPGAKKSLKQAASAKTAVKPASKPKGSQRRRSPGVPRQKTVAAKVKEKALTTKSKALNIPPILLEGDLTPTPKLTGPGVRYALAPGPLVEHFPAPEHELPEGYGTQRLFLTARDPHWLYASWDLTAEQQREFNRLSRDGHLILRVFKDDEKIPIVPDVHVHPESRTWFVSVPHAETRYRAELGLYDEYGTWASISQSPGTFTPPDAPSSEVAAEFATIPVQVSFGQVVETVQEFIAGHKPLLEAVAAAQEAQQPQRSTAPEQTMMSQVVEAPSAPKVERNGFRSPPPEERLHEPPPQQQPKPRKEPKARTGQSLPPIRVERSEPWTPERREALAQLISIDSYRRVWMGSIEITELVRRQLKERLQEEVSSIAAAELARAAAELPGPGLVAGISSPYGGEISRGRKFWFKVNAELIIYGATEPDARVSIADRVIKLRPDGTFSFRFALPDGQYQLPTLAISGDGEEGREARLEFRRSTEYRGHVEAHPQDPSLRAPRPENL